MDQFFPALFAQLRVRGLSARDCRDVAHRAAANLSTRAALPAAPADLQALLREEAEAIWQRWQPAPASSLPPVESPQPDREMDAMWNWIAEQGPRIRSIVRRKLGRVHAADVDDVVADVQLKMFCLLRRQQQKGDRHLLDGEGERAAYLRTVAMNQSVDLLRRAARWRSLEDQPGLDVPISADEAFRSASGCEQPDEPDASDSIVRFYWDAREVSVEYGCAAEWRTLVAATWNALGFRFLDEEMRFLYAFISPQRRNQRLDRRTRVPSQFLCVQRSIEEAAPDRVSVSKASRNKRAQRLRQKLLPVFEAALARSGRASGWLTLPQRQLLPSSTTTILRPRVPLVPGARPRA